MHPCFRGTLFLRDPHIRISIPFSSHRVIHRSGSRGRQAKHRPERHFFIMGRNTQATRPLTQELPDKNRNGIAMAYSTSFLMFPLLRNDSHIFPKCKAMRNSALGCALFMSGLAKLLLNGSLSLGTRPKQLPDSRENGGCFRRGSEGTGGCTLLPRGY